MPIRHLEERISTWQALPRLANVRKGGEKRQNKKGQEIFGEDLDHFRLEFAEDYPYLKTAFIDMFGEEPAEIGPLMLLPDSFDAWMMAFGKGKLIRKCDGHEQVLYLQDGGYMHTPAPCVARSGHSCDCKPSGTLRFIIPRFSQITGTLGYFLLKTHSTNDIVQIESAIQLAAVGRPLHQCQFVLKRRQEEIAARDAEGRSIRVKKWLVKLEQLDALAFAAPEDRPQLAAAAPSLPTQTQPMVDDEPPWEEDDEIDDAPPPPKRGRSAGARNPWSEPLNVNFVKQQVSFMYRNEYHLNKSIQGLIDANTITAKDKNILAVCLVFAHRAESDYGVSKEELGRALSFALPEGQTVAGLTAWLGERYTLTAAWEAVRKYAEAQREALSDDTPQPPAQKALEDFFEPGDLLSEAAEPQEDIIF